MSSLVAACNAASDSASLSYRNLTSQLSTEGNRRAYANLDLRARFVRRYIRRLAPLLALRSAVVAAAR